MSRSTFLLVATAFGLLTPLTASAQSKHPRLHQAVYEMKSAITELEAGSHNYGGHRVQAIQALKAAYGETELALKAESDPYTTYTPPAGVYGSYANHPHLRHALVEMKAGRLALEQANGRFGGHRVKAMKDIDVAVVEIEKCLQFAK